MCHPVSPAARATAFQPTILFTPKGILVLGLIKIGVLVLFKVTEIPFLKYHVVPVLEFLFELFGFAITSVYSC